MNACMYRLGYHVYVYAYALYTMSMCMHMHECPRNAFNTNACMLSADSQLLDESDNVPVTYYIYYTTVKTVHNVNWVHSVN